MNEEQERSAVEEENRISMKNKSEIYRKKRK
jgi:hypothetical protein